MDRVTSRILATWWISGGRRPSEEPGGLQSGVSCRADGGAGAACEAGRSKGRASPEHEEEEEEREEEEEEGGGGGWWGGGTD